MNLPCPRRAVNPLRDDDTAGFGLRLRHFWKLRAQKFDKDPRTRPRICLLLADTKKEHEEVENLRICEAWSARLVGAFLFEVFQKFCERRVNRLRRPARRRLLVIQT